MGEGTFDIYSFLGTCFLHLLCCLTLEILIKFIFYIFALRQRSSSTAYTVRFPCVGKLEVHGFGKYVPQVHGD